MTNSTTPSTLAAHGVCFAKRRPSKLESNVLRISRPVFASHHLHGFLSAAVGKLSELKEFSLSQNLLSGRIPSTIVDCRKLEILDLAHNSFVGEIPPELSSLTRLGVLDVSSNNFSGDLNFLQRLPNLKHFSVADNLFTGRVPKPVLSLIESKRVRSLIASKSSIAPVPAPSVSQIHRHKNRREKVIREILGFLAGEFAGILFAIVLSLFLFKLAMLLYGGRGLGKPGIVIFSPLIKKQTPWLWSKKMGWLRWRSLGEDAMVMFTEENCQEAMEN